MNILEIHNLSLDLDEKRILMNLSLNLWKGHIHAIVGTNGAGKSTLANTIMGLSGYRTFEGDILFNGESIKDKTIDERARLGITLAWQEPARFEGLSVKDYIMASSVNKDMKEVVYSLELVGLKPEEYLTRAVDKTLSGGERKKVELASIFVMKPVLALLDEPDSGIDIESIERIFKVVKLLQKEGTTVVFITHSMAVLNQADHAFLLCKGQLVDQGNIKRISRYFEDECILCDCNDPMVKKELNND